MSIYILVISFVFFLLLGLPVAYVIGISSLLGILATNIPVVIVFQRMFAGVNSFPLLCIPFFILMGKVMEAGGIAERLVNLANIIVGRLKGGLAAVNIVTSMFFAGISGSAVADTSSVGSILIPLMNEEGYDRDFSVSVTVASSTIGMIIPPSNIMIVYSYVSGGTSIGKLFAGGIIPGIIVGLLMMLLAYIISYKRDYPSHPGVSLKKSIKIALDAFWGLLTIMIIVIGILGGIFTATEAAVVAALYALFVTFFVYRDVPVRELKNILLETVKTTGIVMMLIASSSAFSYLLSYQNIPDKIVNFLLSFSSNPIVILLLINLMLLLVGTFNDMSASVIIFTPLLLPVARSIGMSTIHFGIMMIVNLCIGLCTPPVGSVLFVGVGIGDTSIQNVLKPLSMFLGVMLIVLLLVTFIPSIVMWIPNTVF